MFFKCRIRDEAAFVFESWNSVAEDFGGLFRRNRANRGAELLQSISCGLRQCRQIFPDGSGSARTLFLLLRGFAGTGALAFRRTRHGYDLLFVFTFADAGFFGAPAKNPAHLNSRAGSSPVCAIFTAISATAVTIQSKFS